MWPADELQIRKASWSSPPLCQPPPYPQLTLSQSTFHIFSIRCSERLMLLVSLASVVPRALIPLSLQVLGVGWGGAHGSSPLLSSQPPCEAGEKVAGPGSPRKADRSGSQTL